MLRKCAGVGGAIYAAQFGPIKSVSSVYARPPTAWVLYHAVSWHYLYVDNVPLVRTGLFGQNSNECIPVSHNLVHGQMEHIINSMEWDPNISWLVRVERGGWCVGTGSWCQTQRIFLFGRNANDDNGA